jgi:hypothetical protein
VVILTEETPERKIMSDNQTVPHPLDEVELMEDAIREARDRDDAKEELWRRAQEYMSMEGSDEW